MIISLCGKARAGKDTSALYIQDMFWDRGIDFEIKSYARELKEKIKYDFDMTDEQVYGDLKEVPDIRYIKEVLPTVYWTPRELLQYFGTDVYRKIDPNIWVRLLRKKLDPNKNYIITDARFPNELDWAAEEGGYRLIIQRDDRSDIHNDGHASETSLNDFETSNDIYINNNGTLDELKASLRINVINYILNKNCKGASNG
jgi:hypothetical protein